MQAASLCFAGSLPVKSTKSLVPKRSSNPHSRTRAYPKAVAVAPTEPSTVDYNSSTSVFPAEACDIIGGEACRVQMYPETKLSASPSNGVEKAAPEEVDREYIEYNQPKTVFPGEACDDLGGEFCEADYQTGVYRDMALG